MVTAAILSVINAALIFGGLFLLKKKVLGSATAETSQIQSEIDQISLKLEELVTFAPGYSSPKQLSTVEQQLGTESNELENEKIRLKEVESKLDVAQKNVEAKEGQQQDLKTSKEEDENKLRELMGSYQTISDESIALEKRLAASMKSLEAIISEVSVSDEHKAILNDLLETLTETSSRLRELLTEFQMVNERLTMLNQQFGDLEEEYTKLVEQQLGE